MLQQAVSRGNSKVATTLRLGHHLTSRGHGTADSRCLPFLLQLHMRAAN